MSNKQKFYLIIIGIVALGIGALLFFLLSFSSKKTAEESAKKVNEIQKETAQQVGGVIVKEGYDISYEEGKSRTIITITDSPFLEKLENAKKELQAEGFDFCSDNYLVLTRGGVELPLNWSEEELCKK